MHIKNKQSTTFLECVINEKDVGTEKDLEIFTWPFKTVSKQTKFIRAQEKFEFYNARS